MLILFAQYIMLCFHAVYVEKVLENSLAFARNMVTLHPLIIKQLNEE